MRKGGGAQAQLDLGDLYLSGRGVPQDFDEAASWYRKSAEQGNAHAQTKLGYAYAKGLGVDKDAASALTWFRKAAGQGDPPAEFDLGVMYARGTGVPQNITEAIRWYRLAAEQGDANALRNLAALYIYGLGVPRSYSAAYALYSVSASLEPSSGGLGVIAFREGNIKFRTALPPDITPSEIEAGRVLAQKMTDTGSVLKALDALPQDPDGPSSGVQMPLTAQYLEGMESEFSH